MTSTEQTSQIVARLFPYGINPNKPKEIYRGSFRNIPEINDFAPIKIETIGVGIDEFVKKFRLKIEKFTPVKNLVDVVVLIGYAREDKGAFEDKTRAAFENVFAQGKVEFSYVSTSYHSLKSVKLLADTNSDVVWTN